MHSGSAHHYRIPATLTMTPETFYIDRMKKETRQTSIDEEITRLEKQVDMLLEAVERLTKENRSLRAQQETHATERASLIERNDVARTRVEAIITRLKALESGA
jgi:cell division protein ZapB